MNKTFDKFDDRIQKIEDKINSLKIKRKQEPNIKRKQILSKKIIHLESKKIIYMTHKIADLNWQFETNRRATGDGENGREYNYQQNIWLTEIKELRRKIQELEIQHY